MLIISYLSPYTLIDPASKVPPDDQVKAIDVTDAVNALLLPNPADKKPNGCDGTGILLGRKAV